MKLVLVVTDAVWEREQHRLSCAVLYLVLVVSPVAPEREQHRLSCAVLYLVLVISPVARECGPSPPSLRL